MLVFVSGAMLNKKVLIPFFERLPDWFQPRLKAPHGHWVFPGHGWWELIFFTRHWQLASVGSVSLLLSHVTFARKGALVQIRLLSLTEVAN